MALSLSLSLSPHATSVIRDDNTRTSASIATIIFLIFIINPCFKKAGFICRFIADKVRFSSFTLFRDQIHTKHFVYLFNFFLQSLCAIKAFLRPSQIAFIISESLVSNAAANPSSITI